MTKIREPKYDPYSLTQVPKNAPITSVFLQKIKHLILNAIVGGDGILVERMGENIIIKISPRGLGLGSTGGGMLTATTKAGLPSGVAETKFGRVTAGADQGMVCVRNAANDGWDAFTHFE